MDLDGIQQLMEVQHQAVMDRLDGVDENFKLQRTFCDGRFERIEDDVEDHGKVIAKSKGIITIMGAIWAALTTVAALVAPYFWR